MIDVNEAIKKKREKEESKKGIKLVVAVFFGAAVIISIVSNLKLFKKLYYQITNPYDGKRIEINLDNSSLDDCVYMLESNSKIIASPDYLRNEVISYLKKLDKINSYIPNSEENIKNLKVQFYTKEEFKETVSNIGTGEYNSKTKTINMLDREAYIQSIDFLGEEAQKECFIHETTHSLSNGGFLQPDDQGNAISEGMTALLTSELQTNFRKFDTYTFSRYSVKILQELVGPLKFYNYYFSRDLDGLLSDLSSICGSKEEASNLIYNIDSIHSRRMYKMSAYEEKKQVLDQFVKYEQMKLIKDIETGKYKADEEGSIKLINDVKYINDINKRMFHFEYEQMNECDDLYNKVEIESLSSNEKLDDYIKKFKARDNDFFINKSNELMKNIFEKFATKYDRFYEYLNTNNNQSFQDKHYYYDIVNEEKNLNLVNSNSESMGQLS